jgi:Rps23 Pro-64 3,4-dihydroxylase Tpa1-like proline 4-hydroxylase
LRQVAEVRDDKVIQYTDTVEDHLLRIAHLIRAQRRGDLIEPLIIGPDGLLWDGKHRLAALYACDVPEVDVLDFSDGRSGLLRPPVSLDEVIAPSWRRADAPDVLRERYDKAQPYRHVFIPEVFEAAFAEAIARESEGLAWRLSTTDFYEQYEVSLIDTEQPFDSTALDALREVALSPSFAEFISSITGQGPLDVVDVACHRSTTGQQIGIHNDFYPEGEVCRFTIHLNPDWTINDGGLFVTFASEASAAMKAAYLPAMNSALLFEISPASFHAVTEVTCTRPRYSIVVSFIRRQPTKKVDERLSRLIDIRQNALSLLRPDVVDVHALRRLRTRRCSPISCGGECCRDGAGLLQDESPLLEHLALTYTDELSGLGVSSAGLQKNDTSARTSVVKDADGRTHCSWLMPDGRCSLQVLGENHFRQPWIYKPLACILMPLRVRAHLGARVLTADKRVLNNSTVPEPCLRNDDTAVTLESVVDEIDFIARVWDIDVRATMDVANQVSPEQSRDCGNTIGVVATTDTHILWAVGGDGERVEVLKIPISENAANAAIEERSALQKVAGRWFPTLLENGCDPEDVTRMSFVAGHIPLDVWLRTRPREDEIIDVSCDLLRALVALDDLKMYHLDLAPRNVLINPQERTVVIADFEDAIESGRQVECAGGEFGYAAPEQYLNYLGIHSWVTESFFVGAVIYHACTQRDQERLPAFPFSDLNDVPESLRGVLAALVGNVSQLYAPITRWSARDVLAQWESGRPFEVEPIRPIVISPVEPEQRRLNDQDGSTLIINRRGLTLLRGEDIIARWNGLVDVANTPAVWIEPLCIGPFVITPDGFLRSPRTD